MATRDFYANNFRAAKWLRRTPTATEDHLWLRNRQLDGLKFRRQHRVGRFVLDFYCSDAQLAVEIDGEIHAAPGQQVLDRERQSILEQSGIRFLRVSATEVEGNIERVLRAISEASNGLGGEG